MIRIPFESRADLRLMPLAGSAASAHAQRALAAKPASGISARIKWNPYERLPKNNRSPWQDCRHVHRTLSIPSKRLRSSAVDGPVGAGRAARREPENISSGRGRQDVRRMPRKIWHILHEGLPNFPGPCSLSFPGRGWPSRRGTRPGEGRDEQTIAASVARWWRLQTCASRPSPQPSPCEGEGAGVQAPKKLAHPPRVALFRAFGPLERRLT